MFRFRGSVGDARNYPSRQAIADFFRYLEEVGGLQQIGTHPNGEPMYRIKDEGILRDLKELYGAEARNTRAARRKRGKP